VRVSAPRSAEMLLRKPGLNQRIDVFLNDVVCLHTSIR
jgi:hypothetical protein